MRYVELIEVVRLIAAASVTSVGRALGPAAESASAYALELSGIDVADAVCM